MWVRLRRVWQEATHGRSLPDAGSRLLGEMMATVALIANNIKHDGGVTLHAVGDGPIKTAFAECRGQEALRGIIQTNEDEPQLIEDDMRFQELLGSNRMALTMQFTNGETYQGLVSTERPLLEANIEHYFKSSEQLDTAFALCTAEKTITGCFLQRLPSNERASDLELVNHEVEWLRLVSLFRTLRPGELGDKDVESVLRDMFPSDTIRLHDRKTLRYECSCSRERCLNALQTVSPEELAEMIDDDGSVQVKCEFCGRDFVFVSGELTRSNAM